MKDLHTEWQDAWLLAGARTPFADLGGPLAKVSPIDLGIAAARGAIARAGIDPEAIGCVVAGSVAQASFDAYMLPRHIGLYAGVPVEVPALLVQRVCGTGIEALVQGANAVERQGAGIALCVGAESMSRNPIAAFTHRGGFDLGAPVEFKDFLWEALEDPACGLSMGGTAEELARRHGITRDAVDAYAARSFDRALAAREAGFFDDEIIPLRPATFSREGLRDRGIALPRRVAEVTADTHPRPSPVEALARIRPAFGGVQTGGNSSAVVDGAAAALVCSGAGAQGALPLARLVAATAVGCPPEIMGIGPVPAIRALLHRTGLTLDRIDLVEINEAFGAQVMACARDLGLDEARLNVHGGAIAIGHPLAATGIRLALTCARALRRRGGRYGIASACIGGGQGIALLIEAAA
ncbi:thiolase family protein [Falsiroseomonas selenitidurans]|uniref:Thiolase family protein n=1 Tax=Falsiroseomonas selenitidurans TaxID=2716335 RepID=A0ABX1E4P1_9PROT|nr:thiolase family protein [Falsiroseomonas selenitidurans]NKC32139.1 thiolase family protein [Falsiroseomonas selenitidurans]